jgi:hypothetical protein
MADPRTSPIGPAAIARLFYDPAGEAGRQTETGRQLVEPFTQFNDPNVDPVKQGADLAMTVMGGSSAVPAEANALRMGIKAYHGSPHDFERFDASKIGTGEGAQAYGHGLYLAENEAVAKEYRDKLTGLRTSAATRALDSAGGDVDAAIAGVKAEIDRLKSLPNAGNDAAKRDSFISINEEKLAELNALKNSGSMSKGRMYEVDIAADPEHFLDWDKPLSEQSPQVREKLEKVRQAVPELWSAAGGLRPALPGQYVIDRLGKTEEGAAALREAGIPGIRYLDQGSRGAGTGTSNYVVFSGNEHLISILKKYGLPISAAGLAALSQLHPQEAQAAQQKQQKGKR